MKTVLLNDLLDARAHVLEVNTRAGEDMGKWARAHLGSYCAVGAASRSSLFLHPRCIISLTFSLSGRFHVLCELDGTSEASQATQQRWTQKGQPFPAAFTVADPATEPVRE